jgi:hypothetical protein
LLKAECCGERFDCRVKQSCQGLEVLGRFRFPGRNEIAAGAELAQWFDLSLSIWFHLFSCLCRGFAALGTILQICSIANVVSAGRVNLPKQKPNKNKPFRDFFFAFKLPF